MTTSYNATITIPTPDDTTITTLFTTLADYHPAITTTNADHHLVITYPAENTLHATNTALALICEHALDCHALTIETTSHYDNTLPPIPPLLSVTEAAHLLGITRQAILQRINTHTLPATKVGDTWVIARAAITPR